MNDYGLILRGQFCGSNVREFKAEDGTIKKSHYILVSSGSDFYKVSTDTDYSDLIQFGDEVTCVIRLRTFNNGIYYYAEKVSTN